MPFNRTPDEESEIGVDGPGRAPRDGYAPRTTPGEQTQGGKSDFWDQVGSAWDQGLDLMRQGFGDLGGMIRTYGDMIAERNHATYDPNREWNMVFETGSSSPYEPLPGYDIASQQRSVQMQQQAIQQLQQQASGNYETKAQQELRQQFRQQANQQQALAAGQRGMSAGGQALQARTNAAQGRAGAGGARETLKLQEQQQAQGMLAQILAARQAGDVSLADSMSNYATQGRGLGDTMSQFYLDQGIQNALSQHTLGQDMVAANLGFDLQNRATQRQADNRWMQTIGTAAEAARRASQTNEEP